MVAIKSCAQYNDVDMDSTASVVQALLQSSKGKLKYGYVLSNQESLLQKIVRCLLARVSCTGGSKQAS